MCLIQEAEVRKREKRLAGSKLVRRSRKHASARRTGTFASSITYRPPKPVWTSVKEDAIAWSLTPTVRLVCEDIVHNLCKSFNPALHHWQTSITYSSVPYRILDPRAKLSRQNANVPRLLRRVKDIREMRQFNAQHRVRGCQECCIVSASGSVYTQW